MACKREPFTREDARYGVHSLRSKNPKSHDYMAYDCQLCGAWHIVKRSKR